MQEQTEGDFLSLEITNESMDNGQRTSFEAGDHVLCKAYSLSNYEQIPFTEHPYWAIVTNGTIFIKQIIDETDDTIILHSLNNSPEYTDFSINKADIIQLYFIIKKKPKEVTF